MGGHPLVFKTCWMSHLMELLLQEQRNSSVVLQVMTDYIQNNLKKEVTGQILWGSTTLGLRGL